MTTAKTGKKSSPFHPSDHNDASSTSSCSCDDHSSVASHSEEDPHGDLDYDDDSFKGSPNRRVHKPEQEHSQDVQSNSHIKFGDDLCKSSSPKNENDITLAAKEEESPSEDDLCSIQKPSTIKSFINHDHRRQEDTDADKHHVSELKKSSKDRSHKSYQALLKYFFKDACYFQIKSINRENVDLSKRMGVWSTPLQNEYRLNTAFREHRNVILIFSVQQSGAFQGFARIVSESRPTNEPIPWVLPERLSVTALGGAFRIEWLCMKELSFNETRDLYNAFNNNKPVKVARDGQQVEPKVGRRLCSMFAKDSKKRLLACVETLKNQSRLRKQTLRKNAYYPLDDARAVGAMRRSRNGPHSRLDSGYVNGFVHPNSNSSHETYHMYPQHGAYATNPRDLGNQMRRNGSGNQMIPIHSNRPRPSAFHAIDTYQPHYGYHMPILCPSPHPGTHEEFFSNHYGPNQPYMDPLQHPSSDQHSRPYDDWVMAGMNLNQYPRYHPYQRPKR